jgi:hypothetical protein
VKTQTKLPRWILFGVALVATTIIALELYARTADEFVVSPLSLPADTQAVVLVFHGNEGGGDPVFEEIASAYRADAKADEYVINYTWAPASDNRLRAVSNAQALGRELGEELAGLPELSRIRLVAHSAGAYVLDALCDAVRSGSADPVEIRSIFLDPFGLRGVLDRSHGARNHGRCADFALAIVNTDDPAPASNEFPRQAFTIDITAHPGKTLIDRNGHYWPLQYLAEALAGGDLAAVEESHALLPRGEIREDDGT